MRGLARRAFVNGMAALVACPAIVVVQSVLAEQLAVPRRIGVLLGGLSPDSKEAQQFRQGLSEVGYTEGRDVIIEWRRAGGDVARASQLARDLVKNKVDVIVATGTVAAQAVQRATSTIPIVMTVVADPVGSGLVTNLAHPGGNITGFSNMLVELSAKRLELLKEAIPRAARIAVLWNPATPWHIAAIEDLKGPAASSSIELVALSVRSPAEFSSALSRAKRARAQALYVFDDALFLVHRAKLVKLASESRLPAIYGARDFPEEGGLMSYGADYRDLYRRSASYVDKILRGANPGDLPIEQPTKFELVVNLKSARALGLDIPPSVLLRADEVIK